jgi:hypothetical protein
MAPPCDSSPVVEFPWKVLWLTVNEVVAAEMAPPWAAQPAVEFPVIVLWLTVNVPWKE